MGQKDVVKMRMMEQINYLIELSGGPYKEISLWQDPQLKKNLIEGLEKLASMNYADEKIQYMLDAVIERMRKQLEEMIRGETAVKENMQKAHEVINQLRSELKMLREGRPLTSLTISRKLAEIQFLLKKEENMDNSMKNLAGSLEKEMTAVREQE